MRYVSLLLGIVVMLAFIGCGDDPVSSGKDEAIGTPSAKLTMSSTKAGGYVGKMALQRLNQIGLKAFNDHDMAQTLALRTDDVITDYVPLAAPLEGKAGAEGFYGTLFTPPSPGVEPAIYNDLERQLIAGNIVVNETLITGTHFVEWAGIPPTGNPFSLPHLTISEYEGDKVKKETIFMDNVTLYTQFGVMEAAELPPLVPSITLPDPESTDLSPVQANDALITGFNKAGLDEWSKVLHEDAVIRYCALQMIPMTREEYIALMEINLLGFPDVALEVVWAMDMGDGWVLSEFRSTGTQTGPYFGVPASEEFVVVRWGMLARFGEDGLVREMDVYFDNMSIMVQIGAVQ